MNTFRAFFLVLAVLTGGAVEAQAQAAGAFARMGFGARGIAMSNALAADAFGDASPYYNPALAPFNARQHLEASVALLTLDRELQYLQFATPLRPRAGIAAGLVHAGVAGIDGRDNSGFHTQDYAVDEFAFFLTFGTRIGEKLAAGFGLQLFRADYLEGLSPALSIGVDIGLAYQLTDALSLGFVLDDLLAKYSWDTSDVYGSGGKTTADRFPARIRLGAAYALMGGRARLLAEYESRVTTAELRTSDVELVGDAPREASETETLRLHDSRLRVGAEVWLAAPFAVRAGVDQIGADALNGVKPSAGFMVEQGLGELLLRAEYAFVLEPYAVGTMHLVTLRVFL